MPFAAPPSKSTTLPEQQSLYKSFLLRPESTATRATTTVFRSLPFNTGSYRGTLAVPWSLVVAWWLQPVNPSLKPTLSRIDLTTRLSQCTINLKARVASMGTEPESRSGRGKKSELVDLGRG